MDSEHVQIMDENNNCETQQPNNIQTTVKQERVSDSDSARKKPRKYSDVWNSFDTYVDDDGNNRARCILCKASYAIGTNTHGTTNLKRHIQSCPKKINQDVNQLHFGYEAKLRGKKFNQETYREKMAIAIMKHNYAFSFAEHEGIRDVHFYLNEDVKPYTRNTAKTDCLKIHKREKENIKHILGKASSRICLTSDLWSSCTSEGYICLTAHFVDENWILHSKILNFCHLPPPHLGVVLSEKVFEFLKD